MSELEARAYALWQQDHPGDETAWSALPAYAQFAYIHYAQEAEG